MYNPNLSKKEHGRRRFEELQKRTDKLGTRHIRKIEKFSERFLLIFNFFLHSYRKGILTFAGIAVDVKNDLNAPCARGTFRRFDDGQYKNKDITSCHSNIVTAVITAKKSWGLHCKMWAEGIKEGSFTKREILKVFEDNNIIIPDVFIRELENLIYK